MHRVHLIISGEVQGVGFRSWTRKQAQKLHVAGSVRNREDGAVEVVAEGEKENLDVLLELCRKGPEVAWVKQVDVEWLPATGEFVVFQVLY